MILNKIRRDIKILALRLFLAELILGGVIFAGNYWLDLEGLYHGWFSGIFLKYDLFSVIVFLGLEFLTILLVVWRWQKKYLSVSRSDRLLELLDEGEGEKVEFKSSLRWDLKEEKFNKEIEKTAIKAIAGFMNSQGGTLILGASDGKEIEGLDKDFRTLPKSNKDGWENHLNQLIKNYLGLQVRRLVKVEFSQTEGKTVAVVEVMPADKPVYFRDGEDEKFYVRTGNSTNALLISAATEYIAGHWKNK